MRSDLLDRLAVVRVLGRKVLDMPKDMLEMLVDISAHLGRREREPGSPYYQFEGFDIHDFTHGGLAIVLFGVDPELEREVAIKLWLAKDAKTEAALMLEAKLLARLSHPHVVTIYEAGKWQDRVFFVMERVVGCDGEIWLQQRERSWQELREVFAQAARGLAAAHDVGIQHRDFKPSNMLVGDDGRVRVADFGFARLAHDEDILGPRVGTPVYMAPERLLGDEGGPRSDQFSLCVSMWQAMFGWQPFEGRTRGELLASLGYGSPDAPRWPRWLVEAVLVGLARNPAERYASMHELVEALYDEPVPSPGKRGGWPSFLLGAGMSASVLMVWPSCVGENADADAVQVRDVEPAVESKLVITAEQVIAHVEAGTYGAAVENKWTRECKRRDAVGVPTYADSLRIAEALMQRARQLKMRGDVQGAFIAASDANIWAHSAAQNLRHYGYADVPANELLGEIREFRRIIQPYINQNK